MAPRRCRSRRASSGRCSRCCSCTRTARWRREQIVDALWGEGVPDSAQKMVQIHVSQLRKALPEPRLHTRPPGYLLEVGDDELDLTRFERSVGRRSAGALGGPTPQQARKLLGEALALWRGPALAEFTEPFARHEGARLEELASRRARVADRGRPRARASPRRRSASSRRWSPSTRCASTCARSTCSRSTARAGRPRRSPATRRSGGRSPTSSGSSRPPSLRELERRMLRQDPALDLPGPRRRAPSRPRRTAARAPSDDTVRRRVRAQRRRPHRLPGRRRRAARPRARHGWVCTFQPGWEHPKLAGFYRRLASMGRLILFDKRGTGLSDRVSPERLPDLETRMDDVRAVMDAVGSERAVAARHLRRRSDVGAVRRDAPAADAGARPDGHLRPHACGRPTIRSGGARASLAGASPLIEEDDWAAAVTRDWLAHVGPQTSWTTRRRCAGTRRTCCAARARARTGRSG